MDVHRRRHRSRQERGPHGRAVQLWPAAGPPGRGLRPGRGDGGQHHPLLGGARQPGGQVQPRGLPREGLRPDRPDAGLVRQVRPPGHSGPAQCPGPRGRRRPAAVAAQGVPGPFRSRLAGTHPAVQGPPAGDRLRAAQRAGTHLHRRHEGPLRRLERAGQADHRRHPQDRPAQADHHRQHRLRQSLHLRRAGVHRRPQRRLQLPLVRPQRVPLPETALDEGPGNLPLPRRLQGHLVEPPDDPRELAGAAGLRQGKQGPVVLRRVRLRQRHPRDGGHGLAAGTSSAFSTSSTSPGPTTTTCSARSSRTGWTTSTATCTSTSSPTSACGPSNGRWTCWAT